MKLQLALSLALASTLIVGASALANTDKSGSVTQYLMNPEGKVDGLLLSDGTQVHFPPHLSKQLTDLVKPKDDVTVSGTKESSLVIRADQIKNAKSGKSINDTPPTDAPKPPPPPAPGEGPGLGPDQKPPMAGGPRPPGPRFENLKEMSVSGTITAELNGRRGEVNGAILDNQAIVHFGPKLLDDSKVKLSKGSKIKVTGFGTKNEFGESIEATEVTAQ